ncbi:exopolyphosphatase [Conservatibacter flavescens]|uniref:Exopolyphosphatase n=1 Tax=Conservatibacter flavescens TaxID=28161 RepID=A0A2M8S603_9PAST|nr:exopolyphosphatase [Conservatibacter flavescens]PJG86548.1 exopolyphosphatase [Conservatibacter flavescens]
MSKQATPQLFAAVDLGSNSFHMIIVRIVNGSIQVLSRLKQRVQLAEGLDEKNHLNQAAIERGVACLALFAERLQGIPAANIRTVGTYTLRRAVNNQDFLDAAKAVYPFDIQIISGQEEAELIYSGVSHTQPENGRKLVVDIGGGSTEMIIGDNFTPLRAESRHIGCVSFAKQFFDENKISEKQFNHAYQEALTRIEDLSWDYRNLGWQSVLGSSGTIKTISQIMLENFNKDGIITAENLRQLTELVLKTDSLDKLKIAGLSDDRVNLFLPGLAILRAVFETFRIEQMRYSDGALREGVMYGLEQSFQVDDIRERTINSIMRNFAVDREQAMRVSNTANLLFKKYARWQNLTQTDELQSILIAATKLYEIGLVLNHSGIQKHSAYMLQSMELPGFSPEQKQLLVHLVRFHVKSFKNMELPQHESYFHRQDIIALTLIMRLAVIINRSRQATELTENYILHVNHDATQWELEFENGYLARNPLLLTDLNEEQELLKALDIQLDIKGGNE